MDRPGAAQLPSKRGGLATPSGARGSFASLARQVGHAWRAGAVSMVAFSALAVQAADDNKIIFPSGNATSAAPSITGGGSASTLTLIVALVLGAVGGWMVWRNRRGPGVANGTRNLAVEETKSLGNRQYLVVASYEGKKFLLGVCPGRIDLVAPLNERRGAGESEG